MWKDFITTPEENDALRNCVCDIEREDRHRNEAVEGGGGSNVDGTVTGNEYARNNRRIDGHLEGGVDLRKDR